MIAVNEPVILRIFFKVSFSDHRITKPAGHIEPHCNYKDSARGVNPAHPVVVINLCA